MNLKYQLLNMLADGKFHSGEELGDQLKITRSGIWKLIEKLSDLGIVIYRLKGKGYQIPNGLEFLDLKTIQHYLSNENREKLQIEILREVSSTNQYLLDEIKNGKTTGSVALAEYQSQGRGRQARHWVSPFGANIYLSFLWQFSKDPTELNGLSLAVAVAVSNALEKSGISSIQLKWPNDILWNHKKLAGILVEIIAESHSNTYIVVGVGVNVSMPLGMKPDNNWTDISAILQQKPCRNKIASYLISELYEMFECFQQKGFRSFIKHWQVLDAYYNQPVRLITSTQEFVGIAKGINQKGEFILSQSNEELLFSHGEVSLRLVV